MTRAASKFIENNGKKPYPHDSERQGNGIRHSAKFQQHQV
ncbi:hypothetical protein NEIELOOT_00760 [Neisseria elongata subsp. glycolytica ATCC 29315]|uniref:Uncharacterized protein n=1 Tax=Neisseria elongata subsp. glycolytica ATCC 29315 TaxID=546263 RepID=D4DNX6_NEIEG|nr:hypothetical protein NEIELOOT_00760 [Neisseria elongata subsp. glycolytica ATCC 29315]